MTNITGSALKKVCTSQTLSRCEVLAELINKKIIEYGIGSLDELHEFVGQVSHESGEFSAKSENMNYRAQRLAEVWPVTFSATSKPPYKPNELAYKYEKKPKELANFKYGGKYGNRPGTDDGWNLRGGGYIGLTFYAVWKPYADYKGMTVEDAAKWVRTTDEGAMDSAFWFFYIHRGLKQLAINDDDIKITQRINGGKIGLKSRIEYTELAKKYLV